MKKKQKKYYEKIVVFVVNVKKNRTNAQLIIFLGNY